MRTTIKIGYSDTWGFEDRDSKGNKLSYVLNPYDNYFTDLFSLKYNVVIDNNNPDLLIYGVYGQNYKNYKCKKLLFSGENLRATKQHIPNYNDSTVTLSHYEEEPKEIYMPLWVLHTNWFNKAQPRPLPSNPTYSITLDKISNNRERFITKRKFCCFINNNEIEDRLLLYDLLSKKNQIDSYGSLRNNVGYSLRGSQQDKVNLLLNYKFNIAFENSYHTGYVTEKIIEPFEVGCIPLYNGGERVTEFFNSKCFLFYRDFKTLEEYVDRIIEITSNKELYEDIVMTNPLYEDKINTEFSPNIMLDKILSKLNL